MIFIDTGAFVARQRESDSHHQLAFKGWDELSRSPNRRCFTSSLVMAESMKLIQWGGGCDVAIALGRQLLDSNRITILRSIASQENRAMEMMKKYADQRIGFADCVSIVLMRANKLSTVFGFDRHFELAGLKLWPGQPKG